MAADSTAILITDLGKREAGRHSSISRGDLRQLLEATEPCKGLSCFLQSMWLEQKFLSPPDHSRRVHPQGGTGTQTCPFRSCPSPASSVPAHPSLLGTRGSTWLCCIPPPPCTLIAETVSDHLAPRPESCPAPPLDRALGSHEMISGWNVLDGIQRREQLRFSAVPAC